MLSYLEYLNIPATIAFGIAVVFFILQLIGELLEKTGKIVPEIMKVRKYFARKKKEREVLAKLPEVFDEIRDVPTTLKEVKTLLSEVDKHYSTDNINKRNAWIQWVNDQAKVYDTSISELEKKMDKNNDITLSLLIDNKRDYLLDFTSKAVDLSYPLSKEQYNRFFNVHKEYEEIIKENNMINGQVDVAYDVVSKSYEERLKRHAFIEDTHGYEK